MDQTYFIVMSEVNPGAWGKAQGRCLPLSTEVQTGRVSCQESPVH
jgi:hypothetical protein